MAAKLIDPPEPSHNEKRAVLTVPVERLLDTLNVPHVVNNGGMPGAPGKTTIMMAFTRAQIGDFVIQCHILEHEANGMMQIVRVVAD